jgi:hypothetical protein
MMPRWDWPPRHMDSRCWGRDDSSRTWIVNDVDAPFPFHMYVFNGDGTLQQANPDAGDPNSSDSDGKGIWMIDGDRTKGK